MFSSKFDVAPTKEKRKKGNQEERKPAKQHAPVGCAIDEKENANARRGDSMCLCFREVNWLLRRQFSKPTVPIATAGNNNWLVRAQKKKPKDSLCPHK